MWARLDDESRVVCTSEVQGYVDDLDEQGEPVGNATEIDFPEGFDFSTQDRWRYVDGELVEEPRTETEEEAAAREEEERQTQIRAAVPMLARAMSASLTDAQLLEVPLLFDGWEAGTDYAAGDVVRHGGELYRVAQAHTSQAQWEPGATGTEALYTHVTVDPETGVEEWRRPSGAHDAYDTGDRVLYNGTVYESTIDGNTWSPDEYPQGWEEVRE